MLKNYIKIAWKVLRRRKFFTFISLFGISFTLMILMVVTSLGDHIFGPKMPEKEMDRMLMITFFKTKMKEGNMSGPLSHKFLHDYVKTLKTPENVAIHSVFTEVNAFVNNKKLSLDQKFTDEAFWEITDFNFIEGAGYTKADLDRGNMVAVINQDTKNEYFGPEPAVGKTITLDRKSYRVIGVVKNVPVTRIFTYADVWIPLTTVPEKLGQINNHRGEFMALILAKDESDFPLIQEEYQKVMLEINKQTGAETGVNYSYADNMLETFSRSLFGYQEDSKVGVLVAIVALLMFLFMLLPAINLVNINISRIMERSSEIGVRKAFGATKNALVTQFLVENIFLTLLGSVIGFLISAGVLRMINKSGVIPFADFALNYTVFFYGILIAFVFGLVSGVYPAFKMSRMQSVEALKGGTL